MTMTWAYNQEEFTSCDKNMVGFVYLITNTKSNKKYIGKKHFWSKRKVKGSTRRKTFESDWKSYYGSCEELKADVKELGKEFFKREILYICMHKKSMSYFETYEQFTRNVIMSEEYYNTNVEGKFFSSEAESIYGIVQKSVI